MSLATTEQQTGRRTAPVRSALAGDLAAFGLVAVPVGAMLWLATHGGGYTIDEWGGSGILVCLALAAALIAIDRPAPGPLQLAVPVCLFGLGGLSLLSLAWADWPENTLVEVARYLFYGFIVLLALLALPRPAVRRAAVAMTAGASGLLALAIAYGLWRNSAGADAFIQGRLMGSIGYGGGMAAVMAVAVWPLVGFASDRLTALSLRAASAAGAGAALALVIPTGARAALIALVVSGLAYLALSPTPLRCAAIILPIVATIGLRWSDLNAVFAGGVGGGQVHAAGRAAVLVAVVGGAAGLAQGLLDTRITLRGRAREWATRAGAVAAVIAAGAVLGVGLHATGGNPASWISGRWHHFQQSGNPYRGDVDTRFSSLGGGRYDLWRVAALEFRRHPLSGLGAGNFARGYFQEGRSPSQPQQAHSEPLEVAATLGLPGLLMYMAVVILPVGFAVRSRLRARLPSDRLLAAGIAAALIEFTVHSWVDWTWHIAADAIPAMVLAGAALATASPSPGRPSAAGRRRLMVSAAAALAVVLVAVLLILPAWLAQRALVRSYGATSGDALAAADDAARYDRLSSRPQLAVARAQLRSGDARDALTAARRATADEPNFWIGWQLRFLAARRLGLGQEANTALDEVARLNPSLPLELRFRVPPTRYDHY